MRQNRNDDANTRDPRVRRTQQALREAFLDLMDRKSFESITVGDIVRTAEVNRATFYRHYRDKYDLADGIFAEALGAMLGIIGPAGATISGRQTGPEFREAWESLFRHVGENDRLYRALLGGGGATEFVRRAGDRITEMVRKRAAAGIGARRGGIVGLTGAITVPTSEIPYRLVAIVILGILSWWLTGGRAHDYRELADYTRRYLRGGFFGFFKSS